MSVALTSTDVAEVLALRVAREIAMGLHDTETILKTHEIDAKTWERLQANPVFRGLVVSEATAWNSALNTHERTKLKAAALVEEWLPEANTRAHDPKETLSAKVELMKLLKGIAGMGITNAADGGGGERLSVTINLGADSKLIKIEKDVTPKVIEGTIVQES
jgi:hypothetical protein